MKKFNFLVFIVLGLFFTACNSEVNTKPKEVKFDREVCERCKMIISDRNYAVQVVNPQDGKSYYHDDIGCAILWFEESEISWKNEAIIYVADANSGKWIDAKKAFWTFGATTPMDFGFSAYESKQDGENFEFTHVVQKVKEKKMKNQSKHSGHMGHK